jgi:hypothetical protein
MIQAGIRSKFFNLVTNDPQGHLVLVVGLPGAGKSTYARERAAESDAIYFCPDAWIETLLADSEDVELRDSLRDPVENLQWDLAQQLLLRGETVILDNGFWSEAERSAYWVAALELEVTIEMVALQPALEILMQRVRERNRITARHWQLTDTEMLKAVSSYEPVTLDEIRFYDEGRIEEE